MPPALRSLLPLLLSLCLCLAGGRTAHAESVVLDFAGPLGDNGLPSAWAFKRWAPVVTLGETFEAQARVVDDSGRRALSVRAVNAGLTVGTRRSLDIRRLPVVSWSWKAVEIPTRGSFRSRATNDQALQLLFGFEGGKVVGYIWDGASEVGATGSGLSWQEDVRVIVVEAGSAKVGRWIEEKRNLRDDFVSLFGQEPPALGGVALQSNSQHTASSAIGLLGPIRLSSE
jgi:hypothetical protein